MTTLLLSVLLACGEQTEDSGPTNNNNVTEEPQWFEAGNYQCVERCGDHNREAISLWLDETGSVSDYTMYISADNTLRGRCLIGEPITPDESVWEATCDGLGEVTVYSEGFRIEAEWSVDGNSAISTFE